MRWELAAETIAVKIRWFGLLVGTVLVFVAARDRGPLSAILALGAVYALLDTYYSVRGHVFLDRYPLLISFMEALFIGLLCLYHTGPDSPFRYYYFLSIICAAIRHCPVVTLATCVMHAASFCLLWLSTPREVALDPDRLASFALTLVVMGWVAWAVNAMAALLKGSGEHLGRLNEALRENQAQLEARIAERTRQLQESQAHVLHQEKMAAFGLLAAGIAHEVGNPLTSISSIVQILQGRDCDGYTRTKLALVSDQLRRIQTTLRELINFSRPASTERGRVAVGEILDEALNIAKYYKRVKSRVIEPRVPAGLPILHGVRDQLVQVFLNLILNAIDATGKGGRIELTADVAGGEVVVVVRDDGEGIPPGQQERLFLPYFTTKKHGTGLGLFVTKKLVTQHQGTVDCRSEPGKGTEFIVRLPVGGAATPGHGCGEAVGDLSRAL